MDKNFTNPSYPCIAEIFAGTNFRQCGKGRHVLYVYNAGQKIQISPMRAGSEIGKFFLLEKISNYMVIILEFSVIRHKAVFFVLTNNIVCGSYAETVA